MSHDKRRSRVFSPPRKEKIKARTRHTLFNVQLGIELKRLRNVAAYKYRDRAREIAVECAIELALSDKQYAKYESGEAPPTIAQVIDIARILRKHISPEVFATSYLSHIADLPIK